MSEYKNPRPSPSAKASDPCVVYDNSVSFDKLINENEVVTTYKGVELQSVTSLLEQIESEASVVIQSIGWDPVGEFSTGFTYTKLNDVGRDSSGSWWRYNGSDLPKVITAGTVPSSPNFSVISFETADNVEWEIGKSVGYSLDDQEGFKQALLLEAGKVDSGIPDTASDSQRVDAIIRLMANTPKNALASGIPMDNSVRTTEINAVLSAGNDLYLPSGIIKANGITPTNSTKLIGKGQLSTTIKSSSANSSIIDLSGAPADTKISNLTLEGLGSGSLTVENGITNSGVANARRGEISNLTLKDFSGYGALYSGGWNNISRQTQFLNNKVGLGFKISPQLGGWSGSGYISEGCYFGGNTTAIEMEAIWCASFINPVIENNTLPINQTAGGSAAIWLNAWFESNAQSPRFAQSNVLIGGRLDGGESPTTPFYGNMALPIAPFDYQCITEIVDGVRVFRNAEDEVFAADGQGVKNFKPHLSLGWDVLPVSSSTAKKFSCGRGANALAGGLTSETWGNDLNQWVDATKLVARRTFNSFDVDLMNEYGVKVQGQGTPSGGGIGFIRTVISTGQYQTGGAGSTQGGDRWMYDENGHNTPMVDGAFDVGIAGFRVRDLRIVNNPIVGSDVRIKPKVESITQELLDFVMSIEHFAYLLHGGKRSHYGVVITPEFLDNLSKVQDIDTCAALCRDIFTDSAGKPIEKHLFGEVTPIEYSDYVNDNLIFDVDLSNDFTIKMGNNVIATRRTDKAGKSDIQILSPYLSLAGNQMSLYHVYKEVPNTPQIPKIKYGETDKDFNLRHDAYLAELDEIEKVMADDTPQLVIESGGVILGDLWQVRYAEWQSLVAEAHRREIVSMKHKIAEMDKKINAM